MGLRGVFFEVVGGFLG
jgi:hypothetical protein